MKTTLYKNFLRLIALTVILSLLPSGLGLAISDRPEAAVPFEDNLTSAEGSQITLSFDTVMALTSVNTFQYGGDRLAALQNNDGGWDWPLNDGNLNNASPTNTIGPIGQGLALAHDYTGDPDHLAALQDAGTFLLAKTNTFSPSDGYLAVTLDEIFGGTAYKDHVVNNFYGPLAADAYNRLGLGTLYNTTEYVNLIRASRSGSYANLAAWDIGMGLVGAAMVGADTAPWVTGLKAEIDELNSNNYYDVIGLAGAIYGLAYVGEDHSPSAGSHSAATSLADLGVTLSSYQIPSGGFAWNSGVVTLGEEAIQETSYAILALNELDRTMHLGSIHAAADYIESVQLGTGGWQQYPSYNSGENNEITGEALWGIYTAYPYNQPPVAEANGPYMVAVGQSVALDHTGSFDPDGDALSYNWAVTGAALGTVSMETFTAGTAAGITEVTLTVDDGLGGTATDTAMMVVYDPSGGFVTGGGWIDSPVAQTIAGFNTIPDPLAANYPSQPYQAQQTAEFGDHIQFAGTARNLSSVTVTMSSWAKHSDYPLLPAEGFTHPLTLNIYNVDKSGTTPALGALIRSVTQDFVMQWRPEADPTCPGGTAWRAGDGACYNGFAFNIVFDLTSEGITLPDEIIYGIASNTQTWGYAPIGAPGPYNSLNFALNHISGPSVGTDVEPDAVFWNTKTAAWYSDGGAGGTGTFRRDTGWTGYVPAIRFSVTTPGAYTADPTLGGKATFGFVSKYRRGATVPDGNTEFKFVAGGLNFSSTSYEWLVVTGSNSANFKGNGTINGQGDYKFMLWAGDDSPDTFRIKIWYEDGGNEIVVYDNGSAQPIGGGSIVVHRR